MAEIDNRGTTESDLMRLIAEGADAVDRGRGAAS